MEGAAVFPSTAVALPVFVNSIDQIRKRFALALRGFFWSHSDTCIPGAIRGYDRVSKFYRRASATMPGFSFSEFIVTKR